MAQGLWNVVQKGYDEPPKDDMKKDGEEKKNDGEEKPLWDETKEMQYQENKKDFTPQAYIQQGITSTIFPRIMVATMAKEPRSILKEAYPGTQKVVSSPSSNLNLYILFP